MRARCGCQTRTALDAAVAATFERVADNSEEGVLREFQALNWGKAWTVMDSHRKIRLDTYAFEFLEERARSYSN